MNSSEQAKRKDCKNSSEQAYTYIGSWGCINSSEQVKSLDCMNSSALKSM